MIARELLGGAALLLLLLLQGCASIVSGTTQLVSVDTPGCPAASCELTNEKGRWYVSTTPATTSVSRAYGPLNVVCKQNEITSNATFQSATKAMAFGNIIFGGVIGAGIDIGSGAAYDYPVSISLPMNCAPVTQQLPQPTAALPARSSLKLGIKGESVSEGVAIASGLLRREGVFITAVNEAGLGKALGLKVGQVLLEINGKAILNTEFLARELSMLDNDAALEFLVFEGGRRFGVSRTGSNL